jgi:hypothetical protein
VTYLALGDLLDVAVKTGKSKVTKVRNIKNSDPYSPVVDFGVTDKWTPARRLFPSGYKRMQIHNRKGVGRGPKMSQV